MTSSHEQPAGELRLTTAAELCAALRNPDREVRLATLTAIIDAPDRAQAFGADDGLDLIDELVVLLASDQPSLIRSVAAVALFALDDHRSLEQACRMFAEESDLEILLTAARRIARESDQMVLARFLPVVQTPSDRQRQQIAARMLAGREGLQAGDLLNVALLAGETGAEPPSLTSETVPIWLEALAGEFRDQARGFLLAEGAASFALLRDNWQMLDPDTKVWLLSLGAARFPEQSGELVKTALGDEHEEVRYAALAAIADHEPIRTELRTLLQELPFDHQDSRWTAAAIRAGVPVANLRERVLSEDDTKIRIALIQRLAGEQPSVNVLIRLLEDEDWRIRATATDALVSLGEGAAEAVSGLINHEQVAVRTAVAQVLIHLDRRGTP